DLIAFLCCFSSLICPSGSLHNLPSFPTRRSSDLRASLRRRKSWRQGPVWHLQHTVAAHEPGPRARNDDKGCRLARPFRIDPPGRSEEHTSELQSRENLVCRLLLEKQKKVYALENK